MKTKIKDVSNSEHYKWGDNCDAWHLLKSDTLSVIKEKMPFGTKESYHYHESSQQFFYVLSGTATFEIEGESLILGKDQAIHIPPMKKHRILNQHESVLEFLVISEPKSHGDRINEKHENLID